MVRLLVCVWWEGEWEDETRCDDAGQGCSQRSLNCLHPAILLLLSSAAFSYYPR